MHKYLHLVTITGGSRLFLEAMKLYFTTPLLSSRCRCISYFYNRSYFLADCPSFWRCDHTPNISLGPLQHLYCNLVAKNTKYYDIYCGLFCVSKNFSAFILYTAISSGIISSPFFKFSSPHNGRKFFQLKHSFCSSSLIKLKLAHGLI